MWSYIINLAKNNLKRKVNNAFLHICIYVILKSIYLKESEIEGGIQYCGLSLDSSSTHLKTVSLSNLEVVKFNIGHRYFIFLTDWNQAVDYLEVAGPAIL